MATVNKKLDVTDLDFDQIKNNLKSFLGNQSTFAGYDFSASGLNQILNLLAYNTHYNAYYMNMLASEMFMDTASIRSSVVSKAKLLNYTPRSMTGSVATLQVTVSPGDAPSSLTVDKYTKFGTNVNGKSLTFCTTDSTQITRSLSGTYVSNINVKEGYPVTFTFTKDATDPEQRFIIPSSNVDISTIEVSIKSSTTDATSYVYEKAGDFTEIKALANVYFCSEASNGRYEIEFGDGNVGRALSDGNVIQIKALITNGEDGNGAFSFNPIDAVGGYSNFTITTLIESFGGASRESIDSIKFNAPKVFSAQKRAVTAEDYKALVYANFPEADSIQSWGGETEPSPVYGRVYLCIKPKNADYLTTAQKNTVVSLLSERKILSITPEVVDPIIYKIALTSKIKFDSAQTNLKSADLIKMVRSKILSYGQQELGTFDSNFKYSKVLRLIDNTHNSITNSLLSVKLYTEFTPQLTNAINYTFRFNNRINHPFDGYEGALTSSSFSFASSTGTVYSGCKLEDFNGTVRVYRMQSTTKYIVNSNVGTINYASGVLTLTAFQPSALINNSISLYFEPEESDVAPVKQQIFKIESEDLNITATDVNALERRGVTSVSNTATAVAITTVNSAY